MPSLRWANDWRAAATIPGANSATFPVTQVLKCGGVTAGPQADQQCTIEVVHEERGNRPESELGVHLATGVVVAFEFAVVYKVRTVVMSRGVSMVARTTVVKPPCTLSSRKMKLEEYFHAWRGRASLRHLLTIIVADASGQGTIAPVERNQDCGYIAVAAARRSRRGVGRSRSRNSSHNVTMARAMTLRKVRNRAMGSARTRPAVHPSGSPANLRRSSDRTDASCLHPRAAGWPAASGRLARQRLTRALDPLGGHKFTKR
jgi:hypothetical protein